MNPIEPKSKTSVPQIPSSSSPPSKRNLLEVLEEELAMNLVEQEVNILEDLQEESQQEQKEDENDDDAILSEYQPGKVGISIENINLETEFILISGEEYIFHPSTKCFLPISDIAFVKHFNNWHNLNQKRAEEAQLLAEKREIERIAAMEAEIEMIRSRVSKSSISSSKSSSASSASSSPMKKIVPQQEQKPKVEFWSSLNATCAPKTAAFEPRSTTTGKSRCITPGCKFFGNNGPHCLGCWKMNNPRR